MINCKDISGLVTDFGEGALGFMTRVQFRLHLLFCPDCKRHVEKIGMMTRYLGSLPVDEEFPPHLNPAFETLKEE
jgi:hypothetical protein